ncbi:hypothetical protein BJ138DRAFT_376555 [Hygrophoropsis aurantiaca]|uniref:Uncharacterized protein n=1 Tax=Hygrophoropsis aurantiaca TaxID=72124 RepID=A0ACB8A5E3_9AGAM|nr:hypothetical protein BJ138DRAFT_376555 [Hygrophoropsis aurantiaca]
MPEGYPGYPDEAALRQQPSPHAPPTNLGQNVSLVLSVPFSSPSNGQSTFRATSTTSHSHYPHRSDNDARQLSLSAPYNIYSTSLPPPHLTPYHDPTPTYLPWSAPSDEYTVTAHGQGIYDSREMQFIYTPSFPAPSPYPQPVTVAPAPPPEAGLPRCALAGSLDPTTGIFYRTPEHPRLRTAQACEKCRVRKAKCTGEHPACQRCRTRGLLCHYAPEGRIRGPNKPKAKPTVVDNGSDSDYSEKSGGKESAKQKTVRARATATTSASVPNIRGRPPRESQSSKPVKRRRTASESSTVAKKETPGVVGETSKAENPPIIIPIDNKTLDQTASDKTPTLSGNAPALVKPMKINYNPTVPLDLLLPRSSYISDASDTGSDSATSSSSSAGLSSHSASPFGTRCSSFGSSISSPITPTNELDALQLLDITHAQYPDIDIQSLLEPSALAYRDGEWGTPLEYNYDYGWSETKTGDRRNWDNTTGHLARLEDDTVPLEYPMDFSAG